MAAASSSALNWYTRRLALELQRLGCGPTIIGPKARGSSTSRWNDDGLKVVSCFEKGRLRAVFQAFWTIAKLRPRVVHIQHELFAYGGLATALLLPIAMWLLRLLGVRIVTTIHGVIPLASIDEEFVQANRIPGNPRMAKAAWRFLIRLVAAASHTIQVHEVFLASLLESNYGVPRKKMVVIPIGVETAEPIAQADARRRFGIPLDAEVVLFFGYLAAYKGLPYLFLELPQAFRERPKAELLVAGAIPKRLEGSISIDGLRSLLPAEFQERVRFVGFVPDEDVRHVFAASDLLVLPYTVAMSSSGPLSLSVGSKRNFAISMQLRAAVPEWPLAFPLETGALSDAVVRYFSDDALSQECTDALNALAAERAWPAVAAEVVKLYGR